MVLGTHAQGSIMIGIVFVTVIAWIPGHAASYFGAGSSYAGGQARLDNFKQIVRAPSVGKTGLALDFHGFANGHVSNFLFAAATARAVVAMATRGNLLIHPPAGRARRALDVPLHWRVSFGPRAA